MALPTRNTQLNEIADLDTFYNGGKGSGNFDHAGRPGEVGGSASSGSSSSGSDSEETSKKTLSKKDMKLAEKIFGKGNVTSKKAKGLAELKETEKKIAALDSQFADATKEAERYRKMRTKYGDESSQKYREKARKIGEEMDKLEEKLGKIRDVAGITEDEHLEFMDEFMDDFYDNK